jgi:hypothetical protein
MIDISVQILRIGGPHWYPRTRVIWRTDYENKMTFKIYRGVTEDSVSLIHTYVGTEGIKDYSWDDTFDVNVSDKSNINPRNRFRLYFYKIESYLPSGVLRETTTADTWDAGSYTKYELEIMRGHELYYTKIAGTPFFLFKRKIVDGSGQYCPYHWDKSLQRPKKIHGVGESCPLCLGTGIISPYHEPVEVWIRIKSPDQENQDADKMAKRFQQEQIVCDTNGLPLIHPGDVILDNISRTFYQVDKVDHIGKRHSGVLQNIQARQMVKEKPEYRWLEISADANQEMIHEVIRQSRERRF